MVTIIATYPELNCHRKHIMVPKDYYIIKKGQARSGDMVCNYFEKKFEPIYDWEVGTNVNEENGAIFVRKLDNDALALAIEKGETFANNDFIIEVNADWDYYEISYNDGTEERIWLDWNICFDEV